MVQDYKVKNNHSVRRQIFWQRMNVLQWFCYICNNVLINKATVKFSNKEAIKSVLFIMLLLIKDNENGIEKAMKQ